MSNELRITINWSKGDAEKNVLVKDLGVESDLVNGLLASLIDSKVFWQRDFGGMLSIAYKIDQELYIKELISKCGAELNVEP